MRTAKPHDWNTESLPVKRITIALSRTFSAHEVGQIRKGLVPEQMEDKWFIYWQDDTLFFHRSWTGNCIYIVRFAARGGDWEMVEAEVNRDSEQYEETDDENDAAMISYLIDVLLLHRDADFPSSEPSSELYALMNWSQVGQAMFGKHPSGDEPAQQSATAKKADILNPLASEHSGESRSIPDVGRGVPLNSPMAYTGNSAERTVFECLGVLHTQGYQKLRLRTAVLPSGMFFRYQIAPAASFESDGMLIKSEHIGEALSTSSDGQLPPFNWPEAVSLDPEALADLFLRRCPKLAAAGFGPDPAYAAWYKAMLEMTQPAGLVCFYQDYSDGISVSNLDHVVSVPPPPAPLTSRVPDLSKLEITQVGIAGEYYVAAELSVRGYVASLTLRNSRGIDILASNADATRTISIQVKTNKGGQPRWMLSRKAETFASTEHFYVFVALRPVGQRPEFYIVPSDVVAQHVSDNHAAWLKGTKKNGSVRKDSSMRIFSDDIGLFQEAWDLLYL